MEYKLSPSILSADFCNLEEGIRQTEENGAVYLHFDVMDGVFVPSISFGMPVLKSLRKVTNMCDSGQDQSVWHEDRTGNFTGYTGGGPEGIPW